LPHALLLLCCIILIIGGFLAQTQQIAAGPQLVKNKTLFALYITLLRTINIIAHIIIIMLHSNYRWFFLVFWQLLLLILPLLLKKARKSTK